VGNHNKIYGNNNTIVGNHNKVYGDNNQVTGNHNKGYGISNTFLGNHNKEGRQAPPPPPMSRPTPPPLSRKQLKIMHSMMVEGKMPNQAEYMNAGRKWNLGVLELDEEEYKELEQYMKEYE